MTTDFSTDVAVDVTPPLDSCWIPPKPKYNERYAITTVTLKMRCCANVLVPLLANGALSLNMKQCCKFHSVKLQRPYNRFIYYVHLVSRTAYLILGTKGSPPTGRKGKTRLIFYTKRHGSSWWPTSCVCFKHLEHGRTRGGRTGSWSAEKRPILVAGVRSGILGVPCGTTLDGPFQTDTLVCHTTDVKVLLISY